MARRGVRRWATAGVLAVAALGAVAAVALATGTFRPPQTVEIDIHYSHYTPAEIQVPLGVPVTFASTGQLAFICHLPGHEAYGMVGWVTITP